MLLAFSDIGPMNADFDIVKEATPVILKTDMGFTKLLFSQLQFEPFEIRKTNLHNGVHHVSTKHEPSTKMSIMALILDGPRLTHRTRYLGSLSLMIIVARDGMG